LSRCRIYLPSPPVQPFRPEGPPKRPTTGALSTERAAVPGAQGAQARGRNPNSRDGLRGRAERYRRPWFTPPPISARSEWHGVAWALVQPGKRAWCPPSTGAANQALTLVGPAFQDGGTNVSFKHSHARDDAQLIPSANAHPLGASVQDIDAEAAPASLSVPSQHNNHLLVDDHAALGPARSAFPLIPVPTGFSSRVILGKGPRRGPS